MGGIGGRKAGKAEVEQFRFAGGGYEDVGRFWIAIDALDRDG